MKVERRGPASHQLGATQTGHCSKTSDSSVATKTHPLIDFICNDIAGEEPPARSCQRKANRQGKFRGSISEREGETKALVSM